MQPSQTQSATGYTSTDSGSSDPASPDPKPSGKARWANAHGHVGNPYFRTVTSTSEGSVTVEGNTIHYHAVAGLLIVHPKGWNDAADKGAGDDSPTRGDGMDITRATSRPKLRCSTWPTSRTARAT